MSTMHTDSTEPLTDNERTRNWPYVTCQTYTQMVCTHHRCQEVDRRALVARLAAVEALADEWERQASDPTDPAYKIGLFSAAGELRDALRADPSEVPAQPWAAPVAALREGRVRPGLPARPDPDSSEAPA